MPGQSMARLPGASACTCGAPGFIRVARIDHRRRFFVVDRDQFGGVLRLAKGFRHHHGDRLADIADALAGKRRAERLHQLLAAAAGERRVAAGAFQACRHDVGGGEHRDHAFGRLRLTGVDRNDAGAGVRRAHEDGGGLLGQARIVGVFAGAAHQGVIFQAQLGFAVDEG